ncbi:Na+/H+ antiporter NhaA [Aggregatibacter aphrophilus]|uniref:Na+/H+ antiporter NhaA n=1 Tax=Aggregatibacter aphrophilus TaxID=732 RepID=UPI000DA35951|nr:Na+/H+ antiporter NhaA [Aggregatibacter aphrophilus]RDE93281.1 Na+/H+ antiporter NhaA [Aggregatibacter aphrophilus]SQI97387.1 Sodium/proton antiporter nhaA [Aggregatibacter aphrophilus]
MQRFQKIFQSEATGGILLFIFALMAIILANTALSESYFNFLDTPISVQFGAFSIAKPLLMWVNDGFMAVFFVLVGMEVKREMLEGSLSSYQQAIFPAIAALGGMIVPALIYFLSSQHSPEIQSGWAIPMATDIAFALGIVALLGKRVPLPLKVFLLALAIIDDLGAIIVIAIFYSHELSTQALILAAITITILVLMNRMKIGALCAYMVVGLILWASVLKSGVHATLAGVIIGFCIPMRGRKGEKPLHQFEHILTPWCSYLILPLFAFSNAGVSLENVGFSSLSSPLTLGIMLGLIIGKPLGVFLFSYLSVKCNLAKLPQGINFQQIFAIAVLCGIGFTMSMFLAGLAFGETPHNSFDTLSRLGILLGSGVSAIVGYILLKKTTSN